MVIRILRYLYNAFHEFREGKALKRYHYVVYIKVHLGIE